jgi:hypothetical protein
MSTFDPTEPAPLQYELNDKMIAWTGTGEELQHWKTRAALGPDDVVESNGLLVDGGCEPLGG